MLVSEKSSGLQICTSCLIGIQHKHLRDHSALNIKNGVLPPSSFWFQDNKTKKKQCTNMLPFIVLEMHAGDWCQIKRKNKMIIEQAVVEAKTVPTCFDLFQIQVWMCANLQDQLLQAGFVDTVRSVTTHRRCGFMWRLLQLLLVFLLLSHHCQGLTAAVVCSEVDTFELILKR